MNRHETAHLIVYRALDAALAQAYGPQLTRAEVHEQAEHVCRAAEGDIARHHECAKADRYEAVTR